MCTRNEPDVVVWYVSGEYAVAIVFVFEVGRPAFEAIGIIDGETCLGNRGYGGIYPWEETEFGEYLEAVADAEYRVFLFDEGL